ncbi:MAG: hypothetical protein KGO50_00315 [Myxococcales bacterium]|nr:hypothetical protein [Myxococcales bacterium]
MSLLRASGFCRRSLALSAICVVFMGACTTSSSPLGGSGEGSVQGDTAVAQGSGAGRAADSAPGAAEASAPADGSDGSGAAAGANAGAGSADRPASADQGPANQIEGVGVTAADILLPDGTIRPLTEAQLAIFLGFAEDAEPEVLDTVMEENEGQHFLYSDELHLYNFQPRMADLGGMYVGVGSDQAYLFMGWQRPTIAVLADYDPWISALHRSYLAFFERSEDRAAFRAWWSPDSSELAQQTLREEYADRADLDLILSVYRTARGKVNRRLGEISRMGSITPTFMSDDAQFQYVRQLILAGRVRPMVGNLLDSPGYINIGDAARRLGVPVRNVYTSNAEDYWGYSAQFRDNMRALPFDEQSIITRTRATKPRNQDYRYQQQPALNFVRWLDSGTRSCRTMWGYASVREDEFPITWFTEEPEVAAVDGSGVNE